MRLSERQGIVLPAAIAVVALLANAAVFAARTYPGWRERSSAQALYDRSESELHTVRQQIRSLETIGRGALAADADLRAFLGDRLLEYSRLSELLEQLRASAAGAGVRLERIDHAIESVEALGAVRWQMSAFGAGSYAALRGWLATLDESPGLLFVDRMEISGDGGSVLSVQLTAVALLRVNQPVSP